MLDVVEKSLEGRNMWLEANVNLLLICELTVLFSVTGLRVCCVELVSPSLQAFLAGDGGEACLCKTPEEL